MKRLLVILAVLTIVSVAYVGKKTIAGQQHPPGIAEVVRSPKIRAAMRYHGIGYHYTLAGGVLTFEREGRVCQAYTQAFEAWWANS